MKNIIMCGGSGTRLWPKSRREYPKQFCDLYMDESLFKQTVERNSAFCDEVVVVTNKSHYSIAKKQMDEMGYDKYRALLEPVGRNTAPAVTLACLLYDEDDIVLVSASDHVIDKQKEYEKCVAKGKELAEQGYIVTFGIVPQHPETGYGYIEADGEDVLNFKEKPDYDTAKKYVEMGNFYWNSGMFMFKVGSYLEELKKYAEDVLVKCKEAMLYDGRAIAITEEKMLEIPKISIDYAVMEHSKKIKVVPSDIGWSDLGSYESLYNKLEKDENNNVGFDNYVQANSKNNLVFADKRVVCTIDVEDMVIVDTDDALFISKMGSSQRVNTLIDDLEKASPHITKQHKAVSTEWGMVTVLTDVSGCKVSQLSILPGCETELVINAGEKHNLLVMNGSASVNVGSSEEKSLRSKGLMDIADAEKYLIKNSGTDDLILVQTVIE